MNGPGAGPDRVDQLRERWRAEPSSRGFLQIAEEYRREGRLEDAVSMLDEGLRQQPTYLSALVAKGRCHLDLGQPAAAREALERVVRMDPTQPVANKLLVRTYLDEGDARQARRRLDLYGMLHGGDPEAEDLAARIQALERGDGAAAAAGTMEVAAPAAPAAPTVPTAPVARSGGDVFDLPAVAAPPPRLGLLDDEARRGAASLPADPPGVPAAGGPAGDAVPAGKPGATAAENGDGELFSGLGTAAARRRYLESLSAEGIFTFLAAPPAAPALEAPPPAAPPAPVPAAQTVEAPTPFAHSEAALPLWETTEYEPPVEEETPWAPAEPAAVVDPFAEPAAEPAAEAGPAPSGRLSAVDEWVAEEWVAPPGPAAAPAVLEEPAVPEPEAPPATVTLGQLYLDQGHLAEAERIFLAVERREPGSRAAREGLEELARRRGAGAALTAAALLAGYRPDPARGGDTPAVRKAFVLGRYLERLRRGSEPRVP